MKQKEPPEYLKVEEIQRIADKIPQTWESVAYLTKKFETHEIANLVYSRVNGDEKDKARKMLSMFHDRGGTRQHLAKVLEEIKQVHLSQKVRDGDFIDDKDD